MGTRAHTHTHPSHVCMRRLRTVVRRPNLDHQTQLAVERASQHASRSPQDSTVLAAEAGPFGLHTCGGQQEAVLCKPVQASHFPSGGEGNHNALDYCGPLRTTAVGCEVTLTTAGHEDTASGSMVMTWKCQLAPTACLSACVGGRKGKKSAIFDRLTD